MSHPSDTSISLAIALLTVSDTRTRDNDSSGDLLEQRAIKDGHRIVQRIILPDDRGEIRDQLQHWIAQDAIQVILATGGTGLTGRDCTPEAFADVYEKEMTGFGEIFRMLSYQKIGTSTIQSRASAGVAQGTLLFALPGSPGACRDAWDQIIHHQLDHRTRPCNLVDLLPRLTEGKEKAPSQLTEQGSRKITPTDRRERESAITADRKGDRT